MSTSHGIELTNSACIAVTQIVRSFGEIRMILAYLQYHAFLYKLHKIGLFSIVTLFTTGYPIHEFMHKM